MKKRNTQSMGETDVVIERITRGRVEDQITARREEKGISTKNRTEAL